MTERETTGAETRPPGPGPQPRPRPAGAPWRGRLALIAGSTTTLVAASLLGSALGFLNKAACRSGDWNIYLKQFQAHCYTDIYPLYYNEGLSVGRVPYTGHPVEYPVLIGAAMQAVAWLVRPISDAAIRGREFFDVNVVLRALPAVDRTAGRAGAGPDPRVLHQLGPHRDGAGRGGHGGLGRAPPGPGRGAARAGGGDQVLPAGLLRPAAAAVPAGGQAAGVHRDRGLRRRGLARGEPAGGPHRAHRLGALLPAERHPVRRLGIRLVLLRNRAVALPRHARDRLGQRVLTGDFRSRLRAHRDDHSRGSPAPPAAAGLLPRARRVPARQQGVVAAIRHLAGAARRPGPAAAVVLPPLAGGGGRVLLRDLGLPDHRARDPVGAARGRRHRHRAVLRGAAGTVRHGRAAVRAGHQGHPAPAG